MTLDLTKPVKFRGLDYEIEQVIEMEGYLLVIYVDPVIGRQHIQVSRSGNFTGRDTPTKSTYMHTWDLVNAPEPPVEVWVSMYTKCDLKHFMERRVHITREMADLDASDLKRVGWTLVSRRRVQMTEGVFDE